MEKILKKIKQERIKAIIFCFMSFFAIYVFICLSLYGLLYYSANPGNTITLQPSDVDVKIYDKYMVIDYKVDGIEYHIIRQISKTEQSTPLDHFIFSYKDGYPETIFVSIVNQTDTLNRSFIIAFIVLLLPFLILIPLFYFIIYNKQIKIVKNGFEIKTEVVSNINNRCVVKWFNPDDNKTYYYSFYIKPNKSKWQEKIENIYLIINKTNYKEFYVVGKESEI